MLDRFRKPPLTYTEAPTRGDYAASLTIVGVGLGAILLSGSPGELNTQPPAAMAAESIAGIALFGVGFTRLTEKVIHHVLIRWPGSGEFWSERRNGVSVVHFMTESCLQDGLHPRASRVYIVPRTDGEIAPGPEVPPSLPPSPPTPPLPPVPLPPPPPTPPPDT